MSAEVKNGTPPPDWRYEAVCAEERKLVRKACTRIGWGFLLFLIVEQLLSSVIILIPALSKNIYLEYGISYFFVYCVSPVSMWLLIRKLPRQGGQNLSLSPKAFVRTAVYCIGVINLLNYLTQFVLWLSETLYGFGSGNLLDQISEDLPLPLMIGLSCVAAPIFEELIFRKMILSRLAPFGDRMAIFLCGLLFGLYHLNLYQFFYAFALGMIFAGVVLKTGKLWHSMALHCIVNSVSVLITELAGWNDILAYFLVAGEIVLVVLAILIHIRWWKTYHMEPPKMLVLPEKQVWWACAKSVGMWICTILCLMLSSLITMFA